MKSLIKSRYEGDLVTDLSTDESTIPSQWTRPSFFEKHTLISWEKTGFRIRIRMFLPCPDLDPDPHQFADPDPGKKVRK